MIRNAMSHCGGGLPQIRVQYCLTSLTPSYLSVPFVREQAVHIELRRWLTCLAGQPEEGGCVGFALQQGVDAGGAARHRDDGRLACAAEPHVRCATRTHMSSLPPAT